MPQLIINHPLDVTVPAAAGAFFFDFNLDVLPRHGGAFANTLFTMATVSFELEARRTATSEEKLWFKAIAFLRGAAVEDFNVEYNVPSASIDPKLTFVQMTYASGPRRIRAEFTRAASPVELAATVLWKFKTHT